MRDGQIVVLGEPAMAGFCAGLWAAAGHDVCWIAPSAHVARFHHHGMALTDPGGLEGRIGAETLRCTQDLAPLSTAALIVVADCAGGDADVPVLADRIAKISLVTTPVLSLQSAACPEDPLVACLPEGRGWPGLIPWHVRDLTGADSVATCEGATSAAAATAATAIKLHRQGTGPLILDAGSGAVARELDVPCLEVALQRDVAALHWGRLLEDLLPVSAQLAGLSPGLALRDPGVRRGLADHLTEALRVLERAGLRPRGRQGLPLTLRARILRAPPVPTPVARWLGGARWLGWRDASGVTPPAAMRAALERLLALGADLGVATPLTAELVAALRQTEVPANPGCGSQRPQDSARGTSGVSSAP